MGQWSGGHRTPWRHARNPANADKAGYCVRAAATSSERIHYLTLVPLPGHSRSVALSRVCDTPSSDWIKQAERSTELLHCFQRPVSPLWFHAEPGAAWIALMLRTT